MAIVTPEPEDKDDELSEEDKELLNQALENLKTFVAEETYLPDWYGISQEIPSGIASPEESDPLLPSGHQ